MEAISAVHVSPAMNATSAARDILSIMLRHLGYTCEVCLAEASGGSSAGLELTVPDAQEAEAIIGRNGERLEDLQPLVHKLLRQQQPDAPRVRVDVNGFRLRQEDRFLDDVRRLAEQVRADGVPVKLEPMNSYQRRLVHHLFRDDPAVRSWTPEDESRLKRITLLPRDGGD